MEEMPVDVQDFYRGIYTILCEEFVYSLILTPFLPIFWISSLKTLALYIFQNTVMRMMKRH